MHSAKISENFAFATGNCSFATLRLSAKRLSLTYPPVGPASIRAGMARIRSGGRNPCYLCI